MFYILTGRLGGPHAGMVRKTTIAYTRRDALVYADKCMSRLDPGDWYPRSADGHSICWVNDDETFFVEVEQPA